MKTTSTVKNLFLLLMLLLAQQGIAATISGTVFIDANGNSTKDAAEGGSNAGGPLYVNLINSGNTVIGSALVNTDGTYSLTAPANTTGLKLVLSNSATGTVPGTLPTGYYNTGESVGSGNTATQSTTLGQIELTTGTASIAAQNLGIRAVSTVTAGFYNCQAFATYPAHWEGYGYNPINGILNGNAFSFNFGQSNVYNYTRNWGATVYSSGCSSGYPYFESLSASLTCASTGWPNQVLTTDMAYNPGGGTIGGTNWTTVTFTNTLTALSMMHIIDVESGEDLTFEFLDASGTPLPIAGNVLAYLGSAANISGTYSQPTTTRIRVQGIATAAYNPIWSFQFLNSNIKSVRYYQATDQVGDLQHSYDITFSTYTCLSVNGTVWNDANGNLAIDGSESGSNAGGPLYVNVVNGSGTVIASALVNSDGTYALNGLPANTSNLKLVLTNTATGTTPGPLPAGWVNTGEATGTGNTATQTSTLGQIELTTGTASVTNANFGITPAGYIYVNKKTLNEESSGNFSFTLRNSGGIVLSSFNLNDQATADNVAVSGNNLYVYDLGLSRGSNGADGQLWAVAGTTWGDLNYTASQGAIYYRSPGTSNWVGTGITGARYVDGAYANQMVYINAANNVVFYNNGVSTTIYSGGNAWDVTAGGGRIVISTASAILLYSNTYTANTAPAAGGTWATLNSPGNYSRIDIDWQGSTIAATVIYSNNVFTITTGGSITSLPAPGNGGSTYNDIAWDDSGILYTSAYSSTLANGYIHNYNGSVWTLESQSRNIQGAITAGPGHLVYAVNMLAAPSVQTILSRQQDAAGNVYWIDDERVKNNSSLSGNTIAIPVIPGLYTLTETLPSGWDLNAIDIYDPSGNTTSTVSTQVSNINVSAGEVVRLVYNNQIVNPTAIGTGCGTNFIQTFGTGSPIFHTPLAGLTAYHYVASATPQDGQYTLEKTTANWFQPGTVTDHSGDPDGYFMLINASYASDEFYRQRVTGLSTGSSYTLTFWAADVSPQSLLRPGITAGIADINTGITLGSVNTGNITNTTWTQYSFTFIATSSSVDLFILNNGTGGGGNDLALDDIAFNLTPIPAVSSVTITNPSVCSESATGSLTVNAPVGSNIEYSINGTIFQSSPVFNNLPPGEYTITDRYINTTCTATAQGTIRALICGNVYIDADGLNGTPANTVNGSGTNAGGTLKAILYNNSKNRVEDITSVTSNGKYNLLDDWGDNFTVYLTTNSATVGQAAVPVVALPAGWYNVGENLGSGTGSDGTVNGILPIGAVTTNVTNANFGIDAKPSATTFSYTLDPVPTRGGTYPMDGSYRNMFPLDGVDPEEGPLGDGATFVITGLGNMDGNVLKYNGVQITGATTITNYNPALLTITFNQSGNSGFSFNYAVRDAAGVQSDPASYSVSWGLGVLAVKLVSFEASSQNGKALLAWAAAEENGKEHFELQRSSNSRQWQTLTQIPVKGGTGKNNYSYTDNAPLAGPNYYRLIMNNEGIKAYSPIRRLDFAAKWQLKLSPNPAKAGDAVTLQSNAAISSIKLLDMQSRALKLINGNNTNAGSYRLTTTGLAKGLYFVQVINADGQVQVLKLVKE